MPRRRVREDEGESRPEAIEIAHSPINEQVVIAAALVDETARSALVGRIRPEHFLVAEYRVAWVAISELQRRKLAFDWATLKQLGGDLNVKSLTELAELRPDVPEKPNLDHHVHALYWDRQRAVAVQGPLASLLESLKKPNESPERVRALARQLATSFDGGGAGQFFRSPEDLVASARGEVEKRMAGFACYPFGIEGLDKYEQGATDEKGRDIGGRFRLMPGAAPCEVSVLTGTSGSGKSTVAFHVALGQRRQGRRVLFGAWEMGSTSTLELLACVDLRWSRTDLLEGIDYGHEEKIELEERMHSLVTGDAAITFFDNPFQRQVGGKPSTDRNMDVIHQHLADSGCEVFIADLWERALVSNDPGEEQRALWRQHAIAEETRSHCMLLAQQRLKDIENRADKHATREGIKGSSAWVDMADTVLGANRPALWKRVPDDTMEIDFLKQRKGKWPMRVAFPWDAEFGSIGAGRTVPYDQPGDADGGLNEFQKPQRSGPGRRHKRG